jgi:hypothetical protein
MPNFSCALLNSSVMTISDMEATDNRTHTGLEIIQYVQICMQEDPADRSRISEVVVMLSSETISLEAPLKPALYFRGGNSYSGNTSVDT